MNNQIPFKRFATQVDCSRNAVLTVDSIKRWIDLTSDLGYNALSLYTEDTYEIDSEPYFGCGRGKFTKKELKEIDRYAASKGMEVIPCIESLAHIETIFNWGAYRQIQDCNDVLLVDDERTYALIDKFFATMSECFKSRHINICMDEANSLCRGKYYDIHGPSDKTEVILRHLNRIADIAKKYGYTIIFSPDMFYNYAFGSYNLSYKKLPDNIKAMVPKNAEVICWDYYLRDKKTLAKKLESHKEIASDAWFFGAVWTWSSFTPRNSYSIAALKNSMDVCRKANTNNVIITLWGDDGGECSPFAGLPSVFCASEFAKGNFKMADIKAKFKAKYGIAFDSFMAIDMTEYKYTETGSRNPCKYILYNDIFKGFWDMAMSEHAQEDYEKIARRLSRVRGHKEFGYLFEAAYWLARTNALKCNIGRKIRSAYDNKDKKAIRECISQLKIISSHLNRFYEAYKAQWEKDSKSHGFDIQDVRLGGLMTRIKHCTEKLQRYADGKISCIDELDDEWMDGRSTTNPNHKKFVYGNVSTYTKMVSTNVFLFRE